MASIFCPNCEYRLMQVAKEAPDIKITCPKCKTSLRICVNNTEIHYFQNVRATSPRKPANTEKTFI